MRLARGVVDGHLAALLLIGTQRYRGSRVRKQTTLEDDHLAHLVHHPDLGRFEIN
jgi:hypothetical protein